VTGPTGSGEIEAGGTPTGPTGSGANGPAATDPSQDTTYKWKAFGAVAAYFVTSVLGFAMVFLALPAIADDFGVTLRAASWVVIVNTLTISALLLPMGRLADLIGRRRIHLGGLAVFAAGSVLVAAAPSFGALIVARAVMAVGDAMSQSVSTGILVSVFPAEERGKVIGLQTTAVAIGAAAGPIFTGLILEVLPWRALFALLVVPLALAGLAALRFLDEARLSPSHGDGARDARAAAGGERAPGGERAGGRPFDRVGAVLSGTGIVALVLLVNNPLGVGWGSPPTLALAVAVVALFVAFVRWELRCPAPMLELRFFADPVFALSVAARFVGFTASSVIYLLMPIFLISFRGLTEARAGLILFLNSLGLGVAAQWAGRRSDRFGTRPFIVGGFGLMAVTSLLFATFDESTALVVIGALSLLNGLATGSWNPPNNATILGAVSSASYGVVGAFTNLTRNVGSVFGQAGMAALVSLVMVRRGFDIPLNEIGDSVGSRAAFADGWSAAYVGGAVISVIALVLTLTTRRSGPGSGPATAPGRIRADRG
jgi:MFS family permease